jgi:NodT family efflux transporter outer membrane factor (OMF) lipoprotein
LSACVGYTPIAPSVSAIDRVALTPPAAIAAANDGWPADAWWLDFHDRQLDELMQRALASSPTLAAAQVRLTRARAVSDFARSAAGVQVTGAADLEYGRISGNYIIPRPPLGEGGQNVSQGLATVNLSYDLDLWGKNAALIDAAGAYVAAAGFNRDAARLALTTTIAHAYVQLATQSELNDILLETQKQRQAIRMLTSRRVASGLDTRVEVKLAESNEAALGTDIAQLQSDMRVTQLQLAALTGDMPDNALRIERPALAASAFKVPASLALDLLGRRPELAAQRAMIEAAVGEAKAARAQFYPNIDLNGLAGFQSIGVEHLLRAGSLVTSVGPAVRLPIFDAGRLRANYAARASDIDAAITQYNQSIIDAARDVAEQLTRAAALAREEEANRVALSAAEESYNLAMLRYKGGLSPYLTVLSVESQLLAQRRTAVLIRARSRNLQVSLVRALGGGFFDPNAHAPIAAAP